MLVEVGRKLYTALPSDYPTPKQRCPQFEAENKKIMFISSKNILLTVFMKNKHGLKALSSITKNASKIN